MNRMFKPLIILLMGLSVVAGVLALATTHWEMEQQAKEGTDDDA